MCASMNAYHQPAIVALCLFPLFLYCLLAIPFPLKQISLLLNNQTGEFALSGETIENIVADISADASQFFLDAISVAVAHNELVEIATNAREREPGCQLSQAHVNG